MRRLGQGSRLLILAIDIGNPEQLQIEAIFEVKRSEVALRLISEFVSEWQVNFKGYTKINN